MKRLLTIALTSWALLAAAASGADKFHPLDIEPSANGKLAEAMVRGVEGANLAELPTGEQVFGDVKFKVAEGLIQLGSMRFTDKPEKVEGIKVDRQLDKLHFLHAAQYGGGASKPGDPDFVADDTVIGEYRVNFDDHTAIIIPIMYGKDVRDWFYTQGEQEPSRAKVVWTGDCETAKQFGARIRLYLTSWENPWPDKKVTTIDYSSKKDQTRAAPFCVAITGEQEE
jgi:hypothetical protein